MSGLSERHRLGFGTYSLTGDQAIDIVEAALEAGYRHLDTARLYGNESEVGDGLARSHVPREEVCVATKVAHFEEPEPTPAYVREAVAESRERLGVETIDLLYHHWPRDRADIETVLPVFDELVRAGVVDHVGVSNYTVSDLDRASEVLDATIVANQVEFHPLLYQSELLAAMRERDIALVAYSPVAQGEVFEEPTVLDIADEYDATPAQVSIAWALSKPDVAAIPRTKDPTHLRENWAARETRLELEAIDRIDAIDREMRLEDPEWMEW